MSNTSPGHLLSAYSKLGKLSISVPVALTGFLGYFLHKPEMDRDALLTIFGVFFLSLGFLLGMLKSPVLGISLIFACWAVLVYLIPAAINLFIAAKANNIVSIYDMEMEKLRIIMAFEKKAIDKNITYKYGEKLTEDVKEYVSRYYNNEFKQINEMEDRLRAQMEENIRWYHLVSSI